MQKLLFIIGCLNPIGGEERSISILCNELAKHNKYDITIVCLDGGHAVFPLDEKINVIYLSECAKSRPARFIYLTRMIKQFNYDLIIGYGFSARIPTGIIGRLYKTPVVFCERRDPKYKEDSFSKNLRQKLGFFLINNKKFCAVFQSAAIMNLYTKIERKTIIPNMLDINALYGTNQWEKRDNKIINASRFTAIKNQAMLIKAFSSVCTPACRYTLDIYGKGELDAHLKHTAESGNATHSVKIKPEEADIFRIMNNAKIFVCSSDAEGYPNSLLEAMAMGMACISTDCSGAVRDLIEDGVNGLIVPVGDENAMAEALVRLMRDDELARNIGKRAENVRQTNNKDKLIKEWISFFDDAIRNG